MRKFALLLCMVIVAAVINPGIPVSAISPAAETESAPFDVQPTVDALERIVPDHYEQVILKAVNKGAEGDAFHIAAVNGHLEIAGTSPAVLLTGFNWYLKYVAKANVNWNGEQLNLPRELPLPGQEIVQTANVPHRFALNDTDDGYTGAYRNWEDWERMIDVLALNGINEVLVTVGQEAVYYDTFQEFGYTAQEMREWIPQPSHQPWWLLQNMCCFTGPVSEKLIDTRAELGRKIADRMRELGMTPVFPGYYGTVPANFTDRNPEARVVPQGNWVGFKRPDWLDPRTDIFTRVAEAFYKNQEKRFGSTTMFKMDLLHEGGTAGNVPVGAAAKAVETALQSAHPGAIWAILGWQSNPSATLLSMLDKTKVLVLDGLADRYSNLNREQSWPDTPYAYGSIWNFGGHTTIGANLAEWNTDYWAKKAKAGSKLSGIALMPEGSENNPAAFDFFTELAWQQGPVDLGDWFDAWAERRYGGVDLSAQAAWQTIRKTAYQMPAGSWSEAQDGLFGAQPSLTANKAAAWSPEAMRYDGLAFDQALPAMLDIRPELRNSSAYQYDLMDITRQVLSNRSRILLPQIKAAYDAKDKELFGKLTDTWLSWMELLDRAVATNSQTLLGPHLERARAMAADEAERAKLEYDFRTIVTVWGDRSGSTSGGLHDYANREWAGLVGDFYYSRWQTYFNELKEALSEGRAERSIDWYEFGEAWARKNNDYALEPQGDIYEIAQQVVEELSLSSPLSISVSADRTAIAPGMPATITAVLKNDYSFTYGKDISVAIAASPYFKVKALTPTTIDKLDPGETFTVKYSVVAFDFGELDSLSQMISVESSYRLGDNSEFSRSKSNIGLFVSEGIQDGYQTASFNNAQFGQAGDSFGIYGGGADLWGNTNGFGTIYADDMLVSGTSVTTQVVHQDNTWGWARAGIIARNDLNADGSAGFVNIAVTPSNGCAFSWDGNGDGKFESVSSKEGFAAPVFIKLEREGNVFTGSCSPDGTDWTVIGTATVASAAKQQDVGLFMSAVNINSKLNGFVEFKGLAIHTAGVPVTGIYLDQSQLTLNLDTHTSAKLKAAVAPLNAGNKAVAWSTSNAAVATVDSDGFVQAVGPGKATIAAAAIDGGGRAEAEITVVETGPFVTGIELDKTAVTVNEGAIAELTAKVWPADAWNRNVIWSSSDESIVQVDDSGVGRAFITGIKAGTAIITATTAEGGFKATSEVTVVPPPINLALNKPTAASSSSSPASRGNDGDLTSMWIASGGGAGNWWEVDLGDIYSLTGTQIYFEKQVLWKYKIEVSTNRSDWTIVVDKLNNTDTSQVQTSSFAAQGRFARITFDQAPGQNWTAFQELLVFGYPKVPVSGIQLSPASVTVEIGNTAALSASVEPVHATNKKVVWASSDDTVAKVTVENGVAIVTGVAEGTATITVTTEDGGYQASSIVTVVQETAEGPLTTLEGSASVQTGQPYTVTFGLSRLAERIYAQDITLHYDPRVFEFVSAKSVKEGVQLLETANDPAGKLRLIIASGGEEHAVIGEAQIVELVFKAISGQSSGASVIVVTEALLGDGQGNEIEAGGSSLNVQVKAGIPGDLNQDGRLSIGDLAIAAAYYGITDSSPEWTRAQAADMNGDGQIDIADLAAIAAKLLAI